MLNSSLIKLTETVEGFLSQKEGEVLYRLASRCPQKGIIVEIGSWHGKSTICLGKGAEEKKAHIYAIDHHQGSPQHHAVYGKVWTFDIFSENIGKAGLAHLITPLVKSSKEAQHEIPGPIDLVFIDGAHEYEEVKEDFEIYYPKLKEGGVIAFHDSFGHGWPGVRKIVHEQLFRGRDFKRIRYVDGITFATKVRNNTFADRIGNYVSLGVKCLHEASLSLPLPLKKAARRFIWRPFQRRWLSELEKTSHQHLNAVF